MTFDEVLGLKLGQIKSSKQKTPNEVKILISRREKLRKLGKFKGADLMRDEILKLGFAVIDKKIVR